MTTTKAVVINQYGGKEQLTDATVTLPELSAHQVLVKVKATSVNPLDWKLREGYLQQMMPWEFPIILGWDVAGIIEEVGSQVSDWKVGDWVAARPDTTRFGTYAEHTIVDDHLLAKLPEEVSFKDAGALPLAGLTAYQALFTHGKLQAGQKVLIHAGAGGVGTYAIQLAKEAGAYVITTASPKNHQLLKELDHQQAQLDIANNMVNLQQSKNKLEDEYINKLLKQKSKLEKELHELQSNNYPTREQLDNWIFSMQAQNKLSNREANRIMKIYDIKGIYPPGKLPTRKD